ncbi:hypothetical protein F511_18036 [Dorcoceras hygrometricum]|uniref:DNA-directed RNA polymerase n=1 Tax=Dorcoceras hygrometricum TaxID=472368 RepID=A0A2Z7A9R4_9LAMI|nr:hypothetical protein F511_18036 [Dorcoceras hygrometricum]
MFLGVTSPPLSLALLLTPSHFRHRRRHRPRCRNSFRSYRRDDSVHEIFTGFLVQTSEGIEIPIVDRIGRLEMFNRGTAFAAFRCLNQTVKLSDRLRTQVSSSDILHKAPSIIVRISMASKISQNNELNEQEADRKWQRPHLAEEKDYAALEELFKHHIDSFNYMLEHGLETMLMNIKPVECRQAKLTYAGRFMVELYFQYDDGASVREGYNFGQFPIMLKSNLCHLKAANDQKKLVSLQEEPSEMGGYFILNGLERVVRLLILPKQNYPMSTVRNSFRDKREGYTDKAVVIRCVREDQSAVTVKLYYLNNGSARLGFWIRGREYLLPVGIILKALADTTDREIYVILTCCFSEKYDRVKGSVGTQLVGERAKIILDELQNLSLFTRSQCLQHIGEHFQPVMTGLAKESYTVVGNAVLKDYIFVHLDDNLDKFNLLIFMLQKLFSFIDQTSLADNPDSLQNQEVLLPGHLITIYLKERLQDWLVKVKRLLQDEVDDRTKKFELSSLADVKKVIEKNSPRQIGAIVQNLLKTGRLVTQTGLDLQQW